MRNSTFSLLSKPNLKLAQLYGEDNNLSDANTHTALTVAGLLTTVEDLTKFMLAINRENRVLSQETLNLMMEPQNFINKIAV